MGEEDYNNTEVKVSKYNSGIAQIYRMDNLWKDTHSHSRNGELDKWNWDLDRCWVELAADLSEKDELVLKFEGINKDIASFRSDLKERKVSVTKYLSNMYQKLMEKELFLRRLQNKVGKGTAFDEDDDYLE